MRKKELSICIGIHHIATFIGILEGLYYLIVSHKKPCVWKYWGVFLLTALQSFAGIKILVDLRDRHSRLADSYKNLEDIKSSRKQKRNILWGSAILSALFKTLPVYLLGHD